MLSTAQVNVLNRRLAEGESVDRIDGFALSSKRGIPTDWGRVVASEPPMEVAFEPPAFVLGEPEDPSCLDDVREPVRLQVPAKTIRSFRDVRIVGWRSLLSGDGFYSTRRGFREEEGSLEAWSGGIYDGFVVKDGALIHAAGDDDRRSINGNTLFLSGVELGNYGSFVFRLLPKLLFFREHGIGVDQIVVPIRTSAIEDAVGMAGLGGVPLYAVRESLALEFETVYAVDDFDIKGGMCAASMSRLRSLAPGHSGKGAIFVSRRLNAHNPTYRPLANAAEVERAAERMGFRIVFPESMRFPRQVALFAASDSIVGPSGSGMLNTLFCRPGCKVLDIESFHSTVRQHARIYSSSGHRYGFAFGRFDPDDKREPKFIRRWTASPGTIVEGIERLRSS